MTHILVFFYILRELIPQFLSTLVIICSVVVVSQLVRLSEVLITFGLSIENILLPFIYIILPFLTFIIPISYFFAVLVTFSRLSADGEYTALLSAGHSLKKILMPVLLLGTILYGIGAVSSMHFEAWGRRELVNFFYEKTQNQLDNMVKFKLRSGVFVDNFLGYVIYAEKISKDKTNLQNVILAPGESSDITSDMLISAPKGRFNGSVENGDLKLTLLNGTVFGQSLESEESTILNFQESEIDLLGLFEKQIFGSEQIEDDYRSYPPGRLYAFIQKIKADPKTSKPLYWKANFLYFWRLGTPLAVVSMALFGVFLGIQDQRRAKNRAFLLGLTSIMLSYVLIMGFRWLAENGYMVAPLAAFLPNLLLGLFGFFLLYQKNRLPLSEPALAIRNIPFLNRILEPR